MGMKSPAQSFIFVYMLLGSLSYGSSKNNISDLLEEKLRTCCALTKTPLSYETVRSSMDRFMRKMPTKHSTVSQIALLETSFQVPAYITLRMATHYGLVA